MAAAKAKHVVVSEYDPSWPDDFEALRAPIWAAMSNVATAIEHVGGTSVPGLSAKPVIDMDVVVPDGRVAEAIERLASLGYRHRGDLGIRGREAFDAPRDTPRHHLYLCPAGSPALANHLAIRDHLRANPAAASAYGELKKRLADEHARDIDGYIAGKTDFLIGILREAGFDERVLAEIVRANATP